MDVLERFLRYVQYDTQSDPSSSTAPTTLKQRNLGALLVEELKALGIDDAFMDDYGIVYAHVAGEGETIGFIAHMDTSPDLTGENVNPRIIENYDGSDIVLNEALNITMSPKRFKSLNKDIGSDLIVTDGLTLLGADDKAGIAEIMCMLAYFKAHPEVKHHPLAIAFTPDEEVGLGTQHFNLDTFNASYAYTVDGGDVEDVEYENFNAASAIVEIQGQSIHPGSAKGQMINSILVGMEFQSLLPVFDNPAYTEGYEGFNHLESFHGGCEKTTLEYIIRNHDASKLEKQKNDFMNAQDFLNRKYGEGTVLLTINDSYKNMRSYIEERMDIVERAYRAIESIGLTPKSSAIRGGTDGASLTYKGLPCPNLGTGGRNFHGKYEYASIREMKQCVQVLIEIAKAYL